MWAWFQPSALDEGEGDLVSRDGERLGSVSFSDGSASGEVEVDGTPIAFDAEPAVGEAGLYRLAENGTETGWIVLPDGNFKGVRTQGGIGTRAKSRPVSGIEESQTPELAPVVTDP